MNSWIQIQWMNVFTLLPIESVVRDRQIDYYQTLGNADKQGDATGFVVFMLKSIQQAIAEAAVITDQVARLLKALKSGPKSAAELMDELEMSHRPTFRKNYLHPAMDAGLVKMTNPDSPNAKNQKYTL